MASNIKIGTLRTVPKSKFPYSYKFGKSGFYGVMFSNNISGICVAGNQSTENGIREQLISVNFNDNIQIINDNSFQNCRYLRNTGICDGLISVGIESYRDCVNIQELYIPQSMEGIGDRAFYGCTNLSSVTFDTLEDDNISSYQNFNLQKIGSCVFHSCPNLNFLAIPENITDKSYFDENFLSGSNIDTLSFLGLDDSSIKELSSSKILGLKKNCIIYSKEGYKYQYLSSNGSITKTSFSWYDSMKTPIAGRIKMGTVNIFQNDCVGWCLYPETRTTQTGSDKFPGVSCPTVIIYLDPKTSSKSRDFMQSVIESESFSSILKQKKYFIFALMRNGDYTNSDGNVSYFRNTVNNGIDYEKSFPSINLYYNGKSTCFTTDSLNPSVVISKIDEFGNEIGFSDFESDSFEVKLEDPYVETLKSGTPTRKYTPWWYNNGTYVSLSEWNI